MLSTSSGVWSAFLLTLTLSCTRAGAINVATFAELQSAVAIGGSIVVTENIVFPSTLSITKSVNITGSCNGGPCVLDGDGAVRIFRLSGGNFNFNNLNLARGLAVRSSSLPPLPPIIIFCILSLS